jgi:hypothetical protein
LQAAGQKCPAVFVGGAFGPPIWQLGNGLNGRLTGNLYKGLKRAGQPAFEKRKSTT